MASGITCVYSSLTDAAVTARMVRSSMLEVMREDYIRTAGQRFK